MDLRAHISYINRFTKLTTEDAKNFAWHVLCQLSVRLSFSRYPSKNDKDMECLKFGICSYQAQAQRVNLYNASNEILRTDFNILSIITDIFNILISLNSRKSKAWKILELHFYYWID